MFFNPVYLLFLAPAILLMAWAQMRVRSAYGHAMQMPAPLSGAAAARYILDQAGCNKVAIEEIPGHLSDHYDPHHKVLRLSSEVYNSRSMAAVGIAAHEAGHAMQDAHGYLFFKGRLREVLRISHFMVAPGEIEAFLMSHPDVEQAFVVGVPDARTNEAAVAYVIAREGSTLTGDDLTAFCRGKIASYKIPRGVAFVKDVPRTPGPHGDKVQRGKLKEQARHDFGD